MEIKDQTMTTATDSDGREFVSEIEATVTETLADGTETTAEITTTANPDDPTQIEGHMIITAVAPDGTETVTEFVTNEDGTFVVEEESALEEFVESALGVEMGDDLTPVDENGNVIEESETDVYLAEPDFPAEGEDFTIGEEMFDQNPLPVADSEIPMPEEIETPYLAEPFDASYISPEPLFTENPVAETPFDPVYETPSNELSDEETLELADQEASVEAATQAQQAADEFVEQGDYAAAAEAREVAENEAWEAGDDTMLGTSDAQDLQFAAEKQEDAEYYQEQQAIHAQEGDYEAAKEDAINAGYATGDADFLAGGADHTGQSDMDEYNLDNAVWHEEIAEDNAQNAADAAEDGNFYAAEMYSENALEEQAVADDFGDQGEPGNILADYDPSSEVETGGSYDADITGFDPNIGSGYDATAGLDTGFDDSMDMAVDTGFDTGVDTSMDSSFDTGTGDV